MNTSQKHSGKGGWLFLGIVVLIYAATAIANQTLMQQSLVAFAQTADKIIPALVLVFILIFFTNLIINPQRVKHYLGAQSGWKGWLISISGGILSAGPVYPWYALLAELKQQGMRHGLISAFLYSRAIKLPLLPLMIHYFGISLTFLLCVYLIGFAMVNGLVMQRLEEKGFVTDGGA